MIGIDVLGEIHDSKLLKGVIDFVLSILGFSGGFDGLRKTRKKGKIDKELDSEKREEIQAILKAYHESTAPKEEHNSLKKLFSNHAPKGAEEYFNIDRNLLHASISDKGSITNINPKILHTLTRGAYLKPSPTNKDERVIDEDKKALLEQNKENIIEGYIAHITPSLMKNKKYIEHLAESHPTDERDTPQEKVLFTIISSFYITENNVIDGIEADIFLPSGFIDAIEPPTPSSNQPTAPSSQPETPITQPEITELPLNERIAKYALDITVTGESRGQYGLVKKNDVNGVSLGIIQRHKERAVNLLKRLKNADTSLFSSIMTDPLFQNLETAGMSARNDIQAEQFKSLMNNEIFKQEMDKQAVEDFARYIEEIKKFGVTQPGALILLARLRNAGS